MEKFIPHQGTNVRCAARPKFYGGKGVRDWARTESRPGTVWMILAKGRPGETYLIGADGKRSNIDVMRALLREMERPEGALGGGARPAGLALWPALQAAAEPAELPDSSPFSSWCNASSPLRGNCRHSRSATMQA